MSQRNTFTGSGFFAPQLVQNLPAFGAPQDGHTHWLSSLTWAATLAMARIYDLIRDALTAFGAPARVVRIAGKKVDYAAEVDQIHVTDPVSLELSALRAQTELLEKKLLAIEAAVQNDNN